MKRTNPLGGGQHLVRRGNHWLRVLRMGHLRRELSQGGGMDRILGWREKMDWRYWNRDLRGDGVSGRRGNV